MNNIIEVESLSKRYLVGHQVDRGRYVALRDVIARGVRDFVRKTADMVHGQQIIQGDEVEEFWALKDISFKVKQGEVLGIIGRNGAGKSTLLKILSRITDPTEGRVVLRGRVASLLEVGTGFHPELTGRENIYLNGAILGVTQREIKRKFDEIVAFAEVEQFIDTPVKRYSSGMYVRLAFSVAAHLEPEILIVDEVLAVGDAAFQKKCLGKMENVASEGQTVLFVSHNMGVIDSLARRAIWLDRGRIVTDGGCGDAVTAYLASGRQATEGAVDLTGHPNRLPKMKPILQMARLKTATLPQTNDFSQLDEIMLEITYDAGASNKLAGAGFIIKTMEGFRVGGFNTYMAVRPPHRIPSKGLIRFIIRARQLNPGTYSLGISLGSHQGFLEDKVEDCLSFVVHAADIYGTGYLLTTEDGVASLSVAYEVDSDYPKSVALGG
jgi:homopolymeric O-antigen transport system ATP-binding protein